MSRLSGFSETVERIRREERERIIAQIEEVISWCSNKEPHCDTCDTLEVVIKRINGDESGYVVIKGENE